MRGRVLQIFLSDRRRLHGCDLASFGAAYTGKLEALGPTRIRICDPLMQQYHRGVMCYVSEREIGVHVHRVCLPANVRVSPPLRQKHLPADGVSWSSIGKQGRYLTGQAEGRAL